MTTARVGMRAAPRSLSLVALCAALAANVSAFARDDGATVKNDVQTCTACHGPMGNKPISPDIPRLAGQQYEYLRQALTAYHNGSRQDPIMSAIAQPLGPSEIDDLAWYFSKQSGLTTRY